MAKQPKKEKAKKARAKVPAPTATPRLPALLRYFQAATSLQLGEADTDDLAARHRVIAHLIQKVISLNSAIAVLDAQLATTTNPPTYTAIALELVEARAERDLCQARSQAINASQPFQDPGSAAEAALLAAISAVDAAAANTAAIAALVDAVHGLTAAYAGSST